MFKLVKLIVKLCTLAVVSALLLILVNYIVFSSTKGKAYAKTDLSLLPASEGIVLIFSDEDILLDTDKQALDVAVALYEREEGTKLYLFGSPKTVFAAEGYLDQQKVKEEDMITESNGFSVYEAMYAMKHVHKVASLTLAGEASKTVRGLYIAGRMGMTANGVKIEAMDLPAHQKLYEGATCVKDFLVVHIHQYQPGKVK